MRVIVTRLVTIIELQVAIDTVLICLHEVTT